MAPYPQRNRALYPPPRHLQVEEARQPVYTRDVVVLQEE